MEQDDNNVNESNSTYKKQIHLFSSFEEADIHHRIQVQKQNPVDRIKETVDLILRVYGFSTADLKKRAPSCIIRIIEHK